MGQDIVKTDIGNGITEVKYKNHNFLGFILISAGLIFTFTIVLIKLGIPMLIAGILVYLTFPYGKFYMDKNGISKKKDMQKIINFTDIKSLVFQEAGPTGYNLLIITKSMKKIRFITSIRGQLTAEFIKESIESGV